jgi:VWFA-related protein
MRGFLFLIPLFALVAAPRAQDRPVFSTNSELVVLHVTVKDSKGAYVTGLPREAFAVVEEGRPQMVGFFADTDTPVTVGLLIDSSGSMHGNRDLVITAATSFVEASHPADEMFALGFNEDVVSALPPSAPFTSESGVLRDALHRSIGAYGRTALYDAISRGLDYLGRGNRERKVLIVLSDGGDNASQATLDQVRTKAQSSNAVIYTIALVDPLARDANPKLLREIADSSGGEAFRPREARDIPSVLQRIARDIRHAYTIGYVPSDVERDGTFRHLRVVVTSPDSRRLHVRSRGGYLAGTRK